MLWAWCKTKATKFKVKATVPSLIYSAVPMSKVSQNRNFLYPIGWCSETKEWVKDARGFVILVVTNYVTKVWFCCHWSQRECCHLLHEQDWVHIEKGPGSAMHLSAVLDQSLFFCTFPNAMGRLLCWTFWSVEDFSPECTSLGSCDRKKTQDFGCLLCI